MAIQKKTASTEIVVQEVKTASITLGIIGQTPLICNSMSAKAQRQLLLGTVKKTGSEKAAHLKHDCYQEYRDSPYRVTDSKETELAVLATAFKGGIAGAARDVPGATKAQMGRLCWVEGERIPLFGVPKIFCAITRSADIAKTPDVRTRAIVPEWCCEITVTFVYPNLRETAICNLLTAAGLTQGVGDWRPEKGSGTYGQYRICDLKDPEFLRIKKAGGKKQQLAALAKPVAYDYDTEELLSWFEEEVKRRGFKTAA